VTAVAGAVAALGLLLVPGRADAHAELVSTEPAASQQLTTAPDQVVLHFTESVDMTDDTIEVLDATGTRVQVGEPEHPGGDGAAVAASLPDLDDGAYVVAWRVVGPLPEDVDQILFPSIQTYASGEVVRWIDEPLESGEEPEHPAPLLTLVDGGTSTATRPRPRRRRPRATRPPTAKRPPASACPTPRARTTSTPPTRSPPSGSSSACSAFWPADSPSSGLGARRSSFANGGIGQSAGVFITSAD
jgi:methionine-rich copper-binding protein CopC